MRLIFKDPSRREVRLAPENLDDLWHLHNLIEKGDVVEAWTFRTRDSREDDKLRSDKMKKERMRLALRVEDVEFAEFVDRLRILGRIVGGPEETTGGHHTITLEADPRQDIRIGKERGFQDHHYARIKESVEAAKRPILVIVSMDDEEATIALLRQYGVQPMANIKGRTGGKMYPSTSGADEYYGSLFSALKHARPASAPCIVVGPGFAREHFLDFIRSREPDFMKGVVTEGTGQAGSVGVQEALKRGIVERIQQEQQVGKDTQLVEELFSEIAKDELATYGKKETREALERGAGRLLLVTDDIMRKPEGEDLLRLAKQVNTPSHIVAVTHEAGKKLQALGGIAALLRYRG
ncbi:MAG TPA: mRNA surveillance protein pelota [Candidatus Thermoplasmatota archaeon]